MSAYFTARELARLRQLRETLPFMGDRPDDEEAPRYRRDVEDIELSRRMFAARIGWKWDAVLPEVPERSRSELRIALLDYDYGPRELRVDDRFMLGKIIAALSLGGVALFGAAVVSKSKTPNYESNASSVGSAGAAVEVISEGEEVFFADHVAAGDLYTLFYFTADW